MINLLRTFPLATGSRTAGRTMSFSPEARGVTMRRCPRCAVYSYRLVKSLNLMIDGYVRGVPTRCALGRSASRRNPAEKALAVESTGRCGFHGQQAEKE